MAKIEALNVEVDVAKAVTALAQLEKNIQDLQKTQKELKESGKELSEEYVANANAIQVLNNEKRSLNKEIQNAIKTQTEEQDSLKSMRAELSNLTKEYDSLSKAERDSAKGEELRDHIKALSDEIKEVEEGTGRFYRNVGNYAGSIQEAFGAMGGTISSTISGTKNAFQNLTIVLGGVKDPADIAKSGVMGFKGALDTLKSHPIIAVISLVIGLLLALKQRISANEDASNKMQVAMSRFKPVLDWVMKAVDFLVERLVDIIDVVSQVAGAITGIIGSFTDYIGITDDAANAADNYAKLEQRKVDAVKRAREAMVEEAEMSMEIQKLMDEAEDKQEESIDTAIGNVKKAREISKKIFEERKKIAEENLAILEAEAEKGVNDAEANQKLAEAKKAVIDADKEMYANDRSYVKKLNSLEKKKQADIDASIKKAEEETKKRKTEHEKQVKEQQEYADRLRKIQYSIEEAQIDLLTDEGRKAVEAIKLKYRKMIDENNKQIKEYYANGKTVHAKELERYNLLINSQMERDIAKQQLITERNINASIQQYNKLYANFLTANFEKQTKPYVEGVMNTIESTLRDMPYTLKDSFQQATQALFDSTKEIFRKVDLPEDSMSSMIEMMFFGKKGNFNVIYKKYLDQMDVVSYNMLKANQEAFESNKRTLAEQFDFYGYEIQKGWEKTIKETGEVTLELTRRGVLEDNELLFRELTPDEEELYRNLRDYKDRLRHVLGLSDIVNEVPYELKELKKLLRETNDTILAEENRKLDIRQNIYESSLTADKEYLKEELEAYDGQTKWWESQATKQLLIEENRLCTLLDKREKFNQMDYDNDEEWKMKKLELDRQVAEQENKIFAEKMAIRQAEASATVQLLGELSGVIAAFDEESKASVAIQKVLGLAQVAINQGIAISSAMKQNAEGSISPVQFAIQMAISLATITSTVASSIKAINSAKFARGGLIGDGVYRGKGSGTSDSNLVQIGNGEAIINKRATDQYSGLLSAINQSTGGRPITTNGVASSADSNNFIAGQMALALRSMPAPVVSVRDINRTQNRVQTIQGRAKF